MGSKERQLSYSIAFQIEVMNYAENMETGQLKGILTEKIIREWRKQRKDLIKADIIIESIVPSRNIGCL